jgi:hypothetical protein
MTDCPDEKKSYLKSPDCILPSYCKAGNDLSPAWNLLRWLFGQMNSDATPDNPSGTKEQAMITKTVLTAAALLLLAGTGPAQQLPIPVEPPGEVIIYQRRADPANVYPNAAWRNFRPRFYRPEFYRPDHPRAFPRSPYYIREIGPMPRQVLPQQ